MSIIRYFDEDYRLSAIIRNRDLQDPRLGKELRLSCRSIHTPDDDVTITDKMAKQIYRYLVKNDYTDDNVALAPTYHAAKRNNTLAKMDYHFSITDLLLLSNCNAFCYP